MRKKKLLFHSNHSKVFTGFGKNAKNILRHLFKTGKYEIIEAGNGFAYGDSSLEDMPWQTIGTLPNDPAKVAQINKDPGLAKRAAYGGEMIDQIIKEVKPDIYLGAEDVWAFDGYWERKWWNKLSCMVWTTLDSLPILPMAVKAAPKIKRFYTWASFASDELNKLGHSHVDTLHGCIETSCFSKLPKEEKLKLRKKFKLPDNRFIIGFVFRNQLRKSVPNLLEGFSSFIKLEPDSEASLLLHTHWAEGWDIARLLKEYNIPNEKVLTTYFCPKCKQYEIKSFEGQEKDCPYCKTKKSQLTTNVKGGVSEAQLNEIYNLMDVYCHPFTSGGQEIPIQEAKLCELITLVTDYSCGTDCTTPDSGGFGLDWSPYREPGTQFIKATTEATSICDTLLKVYNMPHSERVKLGVQARKFVLDNYDTEVIGKKLEEILDSLPFCDWDFNFTEKKRNAEYVPPDIKDDSEWLSDLYKNILNADVDQSDDGHKYWISQINAGKTRDGILAYFRQVAQKENQQSFSKKSFKDFLDDDDSGRRIAFVLPESAGDVFMSTALLGRIKKLYPNHNIYFFTKPAFAELLDGNPHVHKVVPYSEVCEQLLFLEGAGKHEGFFEVAYLPHIGTQRQLNYLHNAKDKIELNLTCTS
jgi:glycosyltransferase involved in cell wall biosynthesis